MSQRITDRVALMHLMSYPSTHDFMLFASKCVVKLDDANAVIEEGEDGVQRKSVGGGGGSKSYTSPVEAKAMFNIGYASRVLDAARAKRDYYLEVVGTTQLVCDAVRNGFIESYGEMLERHYIALASAGTVAKEHDVSERTAQRRMAVACDWCDSQGAREILRLARM